MKNTIPLLSRTPAPSNRARSPTPIYIVTPPHGPGPIPTIRLTAATPSAASVDTSLTSPLAPNPVSASRKRVVPKKSKLALLGGNKAKDKGADFSDLTRRLGVDQNSNRSFDIYVDPTVDPDVGEIVVVKKKKSRAGLSEVGWGAEPLGDITNFTKLPTVENGKPLTSGGKSKQEEKERWWTIGRGRKDSKEKEKEKEKNKDKVKLSIKTSSTEYRERAHSLDSGVVLNFPSLPTVYEPEPEIEYGARPQTVRMGSTPVLFRSQLLRPESPDDLMSSEQVNKPVAGSIANRAMRSVKSLARIGSWAQLKNMGPELKEKEKDVVKEKKEKKKDKERKSKTIRSSGSSFEAGGLSPIIPPVIQNPESTGTVRTVASFLTNASNSSGATSNRLSVESAMRRISTSSSSSVEPNSPPESRRSSTASVRWMDQIETVKEKVKKTTGRKLKESRKSSEGRKRPALSILFPDALGRKNLPLQKEEQKPREKLANVIETTPPRPARPRPMSEQLLGQSRPRGIVGEADGVISILDAATSDLANLINRLDLEATPDASPYTRTPHSTYSRASQAAEMINETPVKKGPKLQSSTTSFTSLRPYAQSRVSHSPSGNQTKHLIGQPIAPWPMLNEVINMASNEVPKLTTGRSETTPTFLRHKRTISPPVVVEDQLPVFQPLQPARTKTNRQQIPKSPGSVSQSSTPEATRSTPIGATVPVASSSMTFGVRPSKFGDYELVSDESFLNTTFNNTADNARTYGHHRKVSSIVSVGLNKLIEEDARRNLGMSGTMGSTGADIQLDPEDPDSDIPEELQMIMLENSRNSSVDAFDDAMAAIPRSLTQSPPLCSPPQEPLPTPDASSSSTVDHSAPIFRVHLIDDEANEGDIEENSESSEDDTKKSFDFTGELRQLNESGAGERRSFVQQIENAFKTPAKLDVKSLGQDFLKPNYSDINIPPILQCSVTSVENPTELELNHSVSGDVDLLQGQSESLPLRSFTDEPLIDNSLPENTSQSSIYVTSKASDGKLNRDFKFGGSPNQSPKGEQLQKPLTLSDIIPSPEHARRLSLLSFEEEDSSVMKSIMAQAVELPDVEVARNRLDSDSSSKRLARQEALSRLIAHRRQSSELSFAGFSAFNQVRLGFEIGSTKPAVLPSAQKSRSKASKHVPQFSMFSIASISSYGDVIKPGSSDPFDYGLPVRPLSDDMSMSVDDTFSFLHHKRNRKRVDSDASSFYFNASKVADQMYKKRHGRNDSALSMISNGPPISLYNRSHGAHRRSDSSTSASSIAHAYGVYGANGGRAAWARHNRNDRSVDSIMSDFSALRLGRPGLGDKMLESVHDYGMPLSAISASPTQSHADAELANKNSFDSILDDERRSSMEDSLFDNTENRSSMSSDSVFGYDDDFAMIHNVDFFPPQQFRPLSVLSYASAHSPHGEDDTMISMLGGGRVRRRSLGSIIEASPCVRVEKRMHDGHIKYGQDIQDLDISYIDGSPDKARLIEKDSIISHKFGEQRMTMAKKGLLERQSLEDSCLSGEGEDSSASSTNARAFRRPLPANRSSHGRPISASSGAETPPLSIADDSSQSGDSQSSIDVSQLNILLLNTSYPATRNIRTRARGHGHRRRVSQAQVSRASAYETIQEEMPGLSNSPSPVKASSFAKIEPELAPTQHAESVEPVVEIVEWDDEENGMILRKYYAWQDEAQTTLQESKRLWEDTPFSIYALQSFSPPKHPAGMQALLEHSIKTYGPLTYDLRLTRRRSRTLSRPSPYPRSRKCSQTSIHSPVSFEINHANSTNILDIKIPNISIGPFDVAPLQERPINLNSNIQSPAPALKPLKPLTPFAINFQDKLLSKDENENLSSFGLPLPPVRPRVASNARRTALGWSKRSTGKSSQENKENIAHGTLTNPNESLRILRPRPRGRPTPRQAVRV